MVYNQGIGNSFCSIVCEFDYFINQITYFKIFSCVEIGND